MDSAGVLSLSDWVAQHATRLCSFFRRRVGCRHTAEDLAQEVYLRLHVQIGDGRDHNLDGLAYRIASNLLVDHARRRTIRARHLVPATGDEQNLPGPPAPEQGVAAQESLIRLAAALDELPEDCRSAFLLQGLEGLSYVEIAARLGISTRMVAKHLQRAMRHSRDRLAEQRA